MKSLPINTKKAGKKANGPKAGHGFLARLDEIKNQTKKALIGAGILIVTARCGGDKLNEIRQKEKEPEEKEPVNQPPGSFRIESVETTHHSASIDWTDSVDPEGDELSYTVELNDGDGDVQVHHTDQSQIELSNLDQGTAYTAHIKAIDSNQNHSKPVQTSFETKDKVLKLFGRDGILPNGKPFAIEGADGDTLCLHYGTDRYNDYIRDKIYEPPDRTSAKALEAQAQWEIDDRSNAAGWESVLHDLEDPDGYSPMPTHPNGQPMAIATYEPSGKFNKEEGWEYYHALILLDENGNVTRKLYVSDFATTLFAIMNDIQQTGHDPSINDFFNSPRDRGPNGENTLASAILRRTIQNWNHTKGKNLGLGKAEAVAHVLTKRKLVDN